MYRIESCRWNKQGFKSVYVPNFCFIKNFKLISLLLLSNIIVAFVWFYDKEISFGVNIAQVYPSVLVYDTEISLGEYGTDVPIWIFCDMKISFKQIPHECDVQDFFYGICPFFFFSNQSRIVILVLSKH